ncbi:MAG: YggS family pyridoxal phosphate-dependent enzyme [Gemmatimonas sp.]
MAEAAQQTPRTPTSDATAIAARLGDVRRRVAQALADARSGERPSVAAATVTLVAVSKGHDATAAEAAIACGQRVFGENRVQEASAKWTPLKARYPDLELHLIGPLQTNKVADAVRLFDVIETVDRDKLAGALAKEMRAASRVLPCFVQVNTGEEPQKAGIAPREADAFIARAREVHGLDIVGAMCIPPVDDNPAPHFALLHEIARRNGLASLSMGMSDDFETAIAFGATHVRIGTAIFGPRS